MTISYPPCVFMESREQEKLSAGHPFCHIVKETIQNIILSNPILHHMARNTLENPNKAAEEQRVQEIIQHMTNTCPTVSGSDSPAIDSTFVDVRAYTGCSTKDPKGRKIARKHIYIQKRLVGEWMKASADPGAPIFLLLTVFMKLCLIRGLVAAVKLSFASEDMTVKDEAHGLPCSLENFLSQWNGWLDFGRGTLAQREKLPYHKLRSIVFSDRASAFTYISVSCDCRYLSISPKATDTITLFLNKWLQEIGQYWTSHRGKRITFTMCYNRIVFECGIPQ
ncbi:hypothetical protein BDR04DRAFT_1138200 [Suillus decipiens]|nr:hypothetical protein BDR04DRAFT_1138200 [Suillus decipiens]